MKKRILPLYVLIREKNKIRIGFSSKYKDVHVYLEESIVLPMVKSNLDEQESENNIIEHDVEEYIIKKYSL